jgi:hypothetical protein
MKAAESVHGRVDGGRISGRWRQILSQHQRVPFRLRDRFVENTSGRVWNTVSHQGSVGLVPGPTRSIRGLTACSLPESRLLDGSGGAAHPSALDR